LKDFKYDQKNITKKIFNLSRRYGWIEFCVDHLSDILNNECTDNESQSMILEMIERFTHLSTSIYSQKLRQLAKLIVDENADPKSVQIVAMTADYSPDSGQRVLYDLKPIFEELNWRGYTGVNIYNQSLKEYKRKMSSNSKIKIIVVDEFVGSGASVIGRYNDIKKIYSDSNNPVVLDIEFKVLASTIVGEDRILMKGINFKSMINVDRGLSDHYKDSELDRKRILMLKLESLLSDSYNGRQMPSFGYGGVEALYSREMGNTPNSVFPIFWWKFLKDNTVRRTMLNRAMDDA